MIGKSRPRRRIRLISAAVLPSRPFLPQSTTMQPIAASVCTAISASSMLARPDDLEAGPLDLRDDLVEAEALEIVGIEGGRREQEGEASEVVHRLLRPYPGAGVGTFHNNLVTAGARPAQAGVEPGH